MSSNDISITVSKSLWDGIISHYYKLYESNNTIGECFSIINDIIHRKCNTTDKHISNHLTSINKIYDYMYDVCGDSILDTLDKLSRDVISADFLEFLKTSTLNKVNMIDFISKFYGIDMCASDRTTEMWVKMRPLCDHGKTRGYSGPAELPLILFCGGSKAKSGDINVLNSNLEIKGDGGRIGSSSAWSGCRKGIESILRFNSPCVSPIVECQLELDIDTSTNTPETKLIIDGSLPDIIVDIIKVARANNIIRNKNDLIDAVGTIQLIEYMSTQKHDWFVLFKHPGKPTVPFGTSFIIDASHACLSYEYFVKLYSSLRANGIAFSPNYDSGGFKIKFMKKARVLK